MGQSAYAVDCTVLLDDTGTPECGIDAGRVVGHIFVKRGTEIDTVANAKLLATYTTLIQARSAYPIPSSWKQEFTPNEQQTVTGSGGATRDLYSLVGQDIFYIPYDILTPEFSARLKSLNNGKWAVYNIHENGYIGGRSIDKVKFLPIDASIRVFSRNKASDEDGGDLPYSVQYDSVDDIDLYGEYVLPTDFNPKTDLDGLIPVYFTVSGTPSASELIVLVATVANDTAVAGGILADFIVLKTDGSVNTPESVAEDPDGTYTFADSDLATGTINFADPADMTLQGYGDQKTPTVFTVT